MRVHHRVTLKKDAFRERKRKYIQPSQLTSRSTPISAPTNSCYHLSIHCAFGIIRYVWGEGNLLFVLEGVCWFGLRGWG